MTSILSNVMHDNAEVEDLSFSTLQYADGSVAQVTASVVHHGEEQGVELQCEKAKIAAPWSCYALREQGQTASPTGTRRWRESWRTSTTACPTCPTRATPARSTTTSPPLEQGQRAHDYR